MPDQPLFGERLILADLFAHRTNVKACSVQSLAIRLLKQADISLSNPDYAALCRQLTRQLESMNSEDLVGYVISGMRKGGGTWWIAEYGERVLFLAEVDKEAARLQHRAQVRRLPVYKKRRRHSRN